jgi:hypothetical protein
MLRDSLAQTYSSKSDEELLSLAADPQSLTEEARRILAEELGRRGLSAPTAPEPVENQRADFWSSGLGKFLRSAFEYLLCFAIAILGSNLILGDINPIVHTQTFSGLFAKMWVSCVLVGLLLGFFVTRYRPTRMALWIWIVPVTLLIYRMVLYGSTQRSGVFGDSFLQHFVAPSCPNDARECLDFSFFTILAVRTATYSLAAWASFQYPRSGTSAAAGVTREALSAEGPRIEGL